MSKKQIEHSINYKNTIEDIAYNLVSVDDIGNDNDIELIYDRYMNRTKCICGVVVLDKNYQKHENSKRHINYLDKLIARNRNQEKDNITLPSSSNR